jgi:hypothetical protein
MLRKPSRLRISSSSLYSKLSNIGVQMHRFFAYEEYGAKYEIMVKDVASTYRTLPQWELYQKGLEALAASLSSVNVQHGQPNKSLTVGDLLVKVRYKNVKGQISSLFLSNWTSAHSASLPISPSFRRDAQANTCLRLSRVAHGD